MQTKLDEAKAELLARAARVAEHSPAGGLLPTGSEQGERPDQDTTLAYLQRYYLHTAPEDLLDRDPVDAFGAALSHYRLAETRPQGTANVRVHTPTVEENGWTSSHLVVEVVTDDMPFLVDSVTNEPSRQNRGIHVVIHPQVVVRRDVTGNEPSPETVPRVKENPMSEIARSKSNGAETAPETQLAAPGARWHRRARRIRNEAVIHLLRGAATAIGGSIVLYAGTWLSLR